MIPVIIGGLFLAAIMLRKKPPAVDAVKPPEETLAPPPGTDGKKDAETAAAVIAASTPVVVEILTGAGGAVGAGALTTAGLVGGAIVVTAAGAGAGYSISGTPEGAVIGGLNATVGNAGNIGAQAGRELHKLLGGDGQWGSLSGASLQLAGFATGVITVVFGALAGVAFVPIVLLVAAVTSGIEDANRLAFGQAGAARKFGEDVKTHLQIAIDGFKKLYPDTPDADLNRYGWAYAIGWVNKLNELAWAQWSKKPPGTGMSFADHMKYGLARGYWYAPTGTTDLPIRATEPFSSSEFWALEEKTALGQVAFGNAVNMGASSANVFQYVWCMNQPRGTFMQADVDHAIYWGSRGWFEGTISPDGTLVYKGVRYDWRAKDKGYIVEAVNDGTPATQVVATAPAPTVMGTIEGYTPKNPLAVSTVSGTGLYSLRRF
jgi:hypothetical protein